MRPLVRRILSVGLTAGAFVLLAVLGLGLAALLSPAEPSRPEPEPVRPAAPPPPAPLPPPPPVAAVEPPRPPPEPPAAAPAPPQPVLPPVLPLPTRLQIRGQLIRGFDALKDELARCPADPVQRKFGTRAAVILELVGENGSARVASTSVESEVPVNDRFVSCARSALEGKSLAAPGVKPGMRLRFFLPIGPTGNSFAPSSASLAEVTAP